MRSTRTLFSLAIAVFGAAACSVTGEVPEGTSGAGAGDGGGLIDPGGSGAGNSVYVLQTEPDCSGADPAEDNDADGYTGSTGDCNDCTSLMNPEALDVAGNSIDEDCSGTADDTPTACDDALDVASNDAADAAKALDICKQSEGRGWGLLSARYVTADGQEPGQFGSEFPLGHGLLSAFGSLVSPQQGKRLLALSSGTARQPSDAGFASPGGFDKEYETGAPDGFPKESPACPGVTTGEPHDSIALELTLKAPKTAQSLKFNLNFYTFEYPVYICSKFNDFFVALLTPKPQGTPDANISFDAEGNLVSVNAGFLEVCTKVDANQTNGKVIACGKGPAELGGTGFDVGQNSAATGWLETVAPVETPGGEIKLRFAIWDSGDGDLDSTVLLDNFRFDNAPATTQTIPVVK